MAYAARLVNGPHLLGDKVERLKQVARTKTTKEPHVGDNFSFDLYCFVFACPEMPGRDLHMTVAYNIDDDCWFLPKIFWSEGFPVELRPEAISIATRKKMY